MSNSEINGYLVKPDAAQGPGVLVLHAWWGLNDLIKETCGRIAGEGFVAFAPDLYRGKLATTIEEAENLSDQLDEKQATSDISAAVDHLRQHTNLPDSPLGVIGFSLGAYYALNLSAQDPQHVRAVVLFYGSGSADFSRAKAAYQGHFAEDDPYEPVEYVNQLESALKSSGNPVTFYRYRGVGHWFFETDRSDAYNEPAAIIAWERAVAFLKHALATQTPGAALQ